jgi:tetratricopeptide (TPR) repeat protein
MEKVSLRDYCEEARSRVESGEPDIAIRITRHILGQYPRHVESYRLLGQALLVAGRYQEAAQQFRRVLSADPEDAASHAGLARIYEATSELDKAVQQMRRAVELSPGDSDLRAQMVRLANAQQEGDTSERIELTRAALGRIYTRRGLYAKAIQEYEAVLTLDADRADVQAALAEALWRAGRHSEAAKLCRHILDKLPNALKANLIIGAAIRFDSPHSNEAKSYLELAQELDPENEVAQSLFGAESPLPSRRVEIERLGKDEIESAKVTLAPTPPAEKLETPKKPELALDGMSELHEEEITPMTDKDRPDEEFEPLPDWLQGVGDDLLEEEDQPAASSPPEQEPAESEETPAWLRDLVSHTEEPDASIESPPSEPEGAPEPEWLQELRPEAPEEAPPDSGAPDWLESIAAGQPPTDLAGEPGPSPDEPALTPAASEADQIDQAGEAREPDEQPTPSEIPAEPMPGAEEGQALWEQILAEEGIDLSSAEESLPPEAAGMTAEEWLRSTGDLPKGPSVPSAPEPVAEEPAGEEPPEEVREVPAVDEAAPPDWLKGLQEPELTLEDEAEEVTTPTPEEEKEPSVLEPMGDVVEETDIPDWLREIGTGEPPPTEKAQPPTDTGAFPQVPVEEDGLPDWLRDFEEPTAEEQELETQDFPPEVSGEPTIDAEEGQALWEQIVAEEEIDLPSEEPLLEEPEAPAVPIVDEVSSPDWLADLEEEEAEEEASVLEPIGDLDEEVELTPGWLHEAEAEEPAATDAELDDVDLPDWLREVAAGEEVHAEEGEPVTPAAEAEVPDWLRELKEPAAEMEPPGEAEALPDLTAEAMEETEETVEAEIDETGLPDWLREPSAEAAEPLAEPEAGPSAEVPEWLTELETDETLLTESAVEESTELGTGEVPDWLSEVMAGEPPIAQEWAAEAEIALPPEVEVEEEQEGRIPDWLRDFRERETYVAEEPTEEVEEAEEFAEAEIQAEPTAPSELPDWLHQLREGAPEPEPMEPEEYPVTEEEPVAEEAEPAVEFPLEPEMIQPDAAGPEWLGELVRAEESLDELEAIEEEIAPEEIVSEEIAAAPEEYVEAVEAEVPEPEEYVEAAEAEVPEPEEYVEAVEAEVPEPEEYVEVVEAEVPEPTLVPEPLGTRELKALRVEDLPKDPNARLSMAHAALNAGDWSEALTIYETLVSSSELLDSVIDDLKVGVRRYPDNANGHQLLGDAFMKDGRLQDALEAYRTALNRL